jgi:hypothetical protein
MAYVNPDSILTGTLGAIEMAASAFDRADRRRREQEQEELRQKAGEFVALNMPKFRDGKLVDEPPEVKYNSAEFKNFANSKYVKPYLMQGVPDYIKDVEYTGMAKTGVKEDGSPVFTPTARWLDEDGKEVSHGPITAYRSKDPNDPVAQFTPDDIYNFGAAAIYKADPQLGQLAHRMVMEQSKGGVIAAYRQAATPEDKAAILNSAAKYWNPSEITNAAAGPLRVENLQRGGYDVDDGQGNRTFVEDEGVREKAKKVNLFQTGQEAERRRTLADTDFATEAGQRQTRQGWHEEDMSTDAETRLRIQELNATRLRQLQSGDTKAAAATQEEIDAALAPSRNQRRASQIASDVTAHSNASLANAPTDVKTLNYKTDKTEEFRRTLNAQDGARFDQGMALINSSDPAQQQQGRQLIQGLIGDPAKADEFVQQKGAVRDLRSALDSDFNGMTLDQVSQTVAKNFAQMPKADQESFLQGLRSGAQRGDRNSITALNTALFPQTGGSGSGSGKAPKLPEYKSEEVVKYAKASGEMDDKQIGEAAIRGRQIFDMTLGNLVSRGVPVDQISEGDLLAASANAVRLEAKGLGNTADTLYTRESLERRYPGTTGTPEEFANELVLPLGNQIKAAGRAPTPQKLSEGVLDTTALLARGLQKEDAVALAAQLSDDVEAKRVADEAAKAGFTTPEAVYDYIAKKFKDRPQPTAGDRVRSLQDAVNSADPAKVVPRVVDSIAGGLRGIATPPPAGPAPSYYQGR